jgi:MarR family transcriptional regulator, organic hydroperoxide resistance regulator
VHQPSERDAMLENNPNKKFYTDLYGFLRATYHYERKLAAAFDLGYREIYVLQYLRLKSPARITEIAKELNLPMFTTSRMIHRLEKKQFVQKVQDTVDRRNIFVSLQPGGDKIVDEIEKQLFEQIKASKFSREEVRAFLRTAEKMSELLEMTRPIR